ncbi:hypothetical protein R9C00_21090 [Flammeovirgaceae bacterium SG7u.111]|nr:hypothetical protein [Flammeovirgaceae bacterium SG7u.132]WPO34198.1 hypothetical protein R9C00_21090 [Flammeovirgaceae bacterium SG7u.111]
MDKRTTLLIPGNYYHIYNRGINRQHVFFEERNYSYFLGKYTKFVHGFAKTFAYCLLKNHYHLLVQIREEKELLKLIHKNQEKPLSWHTSNAFSSFLQGYVQGINKTHGRSGALFEEPFKRMEVLDEVYFTQLVVYIHTNPQKHQLISDFRNYPHSSYHAHLTEKKTKLCREDVLSWFGGEEAYIQAHATNNTSASSEKWMLE